MLCVLSPLCFIDSIVLGVCVFYWLQFTYLNNVWINQLSSNFHISMVIFTNSNAYPAHMNCITSSGDIQTKWSNVWINQLLSFHFSTSIVLFTDSNTCPAHVNCITFNHTMAEYTIIWMLASFIFLHSVIHTCMPMYFFH